MIKAVIAATIILPCFFIMRKFFYNKISARKLYVLWLFVLFILLVPLLMSVDSKRSDLFNHSLAQAIKKVNHELGEIVIQGGEFEAVSDKQRWSTDTAENNVLVKLQKRRSAYTLSDFIQNIWVIGAILTALFICVPYLRFYVKLNGNRVRCHDIEQRLNGKQSRNQKIYHVPCICSPCLVGSAIYIDKNKIQNEQQLIYIISHENQHFRQGDTLWNILRAVCLSLYWFHPFVWIAIKLSRLDTEIACDEAVTCRMNEAEKKSYCTTLLGLATGESYHSRGSSKSPLIMGMAQGRLTGRIKKIMSGKSYRKWNLIFVGAITMILLSGALSIFAFGKFEHPSYGRRMEEIQKNFCLPFVDEVFIDEVKNEDGMLVCHIMNPSGKTWVVEDYWIERLLENEQKWNVCQEKNLNRTEAIYKFWPDEEIAKLSGGEDTIWHDMCADEITEIVKYTREDLRKYYGDLPDGIYRIIYVIYNAESEERGLMTVEWRLGNEE